MTKDNQAVLNDIQLILPSNYPRINLPEYDTERLRRYLNPEVRSSYDEQKALCDIDQLEKVMRDYSSLLEHFSNRKKNLTNLMDSQRDASRDYESTKSTLQREINTLQMKYQELIGRREIINGRINEAKARTLQSQEEIKKLEESINQKKERT